MLVWQILNVLNFKTYLITYWSLYLHIAFSEDYLRKTEHSGCFRVKQWVVCIIMEFVWHLTCLSWGYCHSFLVFVLQSPPSSGSLCPPLLLCCLSPSLTPSFALLMHPRDSSHLCPLGSVSVHWHRDTMSRNQLLCHSGKCKPGFLEIPVITNSMANFAI